MKNLLYDIGLKLELSIRDIEQKNWMYYEDFSNTKPGKIAWVKNKEYNIKAPECLHSWGFCYPFLVLWYARKLRRNISYQEYGLAFKC